MMEEQEEEILEQEQDQVEVEVERIQWVLQEVEVQEVQVELEQLVHYQDHQLLMLEEVVGQELSQADLEDLVEEEQVEQVEVGLV
jgi:hypothetical protein